MAVIDLFTGLLGAGKTTAIRRYCEYLAGQGKSFVIIENEFGSAGVDAALLGADGRRVAELSGGCLCCTMKAGFAQRLLDTSAQTDHIIVEPSGIFTLGDFFEVAEAPSVRECCSIGIVATVVDAGMIKPLAGEDALLFKAQLCGTGSVIVNRCPSEELRQMASDAIRLHTKAPLLYTGSKTEPPDYAMMRRCSPAAQKALRATINHASIYQSTTLFPEDRYTESEIHSIVRKICGGEYGEVLRIKGRLRAQDGSSLFLNATINGIDIESMSQVDAGMINIIGRNLQRKPLRELFKRSI